MDNPQSAMKVAPTEWAVLAVLRFVFAAGVFSQHISSYAPTALTYKLSALGGFPGVAGFLILSGFSIRASYTSQPVGYLKRRVFRIVPVYFVAMLLALLPSALFGTAITAGGYIVPAPSVFRWLGNMFMLDPFYDIPFPANGPLWTVQVELLFYLMAPAIARMNRVTLWGIIVASAVGYSAIPYLCKERALHLFSYGITPAALLWIWLLGWQLHDVRRNIRAASFLFAATAAIFLNYQGDTYYGYARMSPPLLAVAAVAITPHLPAVDRRARSVMNWLGDLSYEIYAFHVPLMTFLCTWTHSAKAVLYAILVLGVSGVVLRYFDQPIRRMVRGA